MGMPVRCEVSLSQSRSSSSRRMVSVLLIWKNCNTHWRQSWISPDELRENATHRKAWEEWEPALTTFSSSESQSLTTNSIRPKQKERLPTIQRWGEDISSKGYPERSVSGRSLTRICSRDLSLRLHELISRRAGSAALVLSLPRAGGRLCLRQQLGRRRAW
jgi:hypothetical protein